MSQVDDAIDKMGGSQEFKRFAKEATREARKSPTPVYIAVLAAFLALVSMASSDADKRALQSHIESANQFAFFQAKNIRKTDSEIAAATFRAMGQAEIGAQWQAKADRYNQEKGEILKAAKGELAKRALATKQGNYFEMAISLLQISIVLASTSLILGGGVLLWGSVLMTLCAAFFTANGYGLYVDVPTSPVDLFDYLRTATGISINSSGG